MADAPSHENAWALELKHPNKTFRYSTSDLGRSDAEYTALGAAYVKGIKNTNTVVVRELVDGYYGINQPSNVTFTINNSAFSTELPEGIALRLESDTIVGLGHGDTVETWRDLSAFSNDATQSVAGERPTFHTNVRNGYPGLDFQSGEGMITGLSLPGDYTAIVGYTYESATSAARRAIAGQSNNWLVGPYNNTYNGFNGAFLSDGAVTESALAIDTMIGGTSGAAYRHNGSATASNASSTVPGVLTLGAENPFAEPLIGYILFVYAWPRKLTIHEAATVEGMVARKYAASGPTFADGMDPKWEWRQVPAVLKHVDRINAVVTTELPGIVLDAVFQGSEVNVTIGTHDDAVLNTLIPTQVVDTTITEFDDATNDVGSAIPVIWGSGCLIHPPMVATDNTTNNPVGFDFVVGYDDPTIVGVFIDTDLESPGLERLSKFVPGPGSPTYASSTTFTVTGDQSKRYAAGDLVRSRTNSADADWQSARLASYSGGTVTVNYGTLKSFATATDLEVSSDVVIFPTEYDGIAMGRGTADLMAFRLYSLEPGGMHVIVNRSLTTNPADVLEEIITNKVWGLSSINVDYEVDSTFATAGTAFDDAGLSQAIRGALAWDKVQRRARDVVNEMLMMRGGILGRDTTDTTPKYTLTVDSEPSAATVTFGLGDGVYNNIKRVIRYATRPLGETIRNLSVAYSQRGRYDKISQSYTPNRYLKRATCAVTGIGVDRVIPSPWLQQDGHAARVAYYIAKILKHGDEQLEIVVGQEGRELVLGELVHVVIPTYGINKEMRVGRIARSLNETTLKLFGYDPEIYTYDGSQVSVTDDPGDNKVVRTPGTGANLLPNAAWAPPLVENTPGDAYTMPTGWGYLNESKFDSIKFDESEAVRLGTLSGHYGEFVVNTTAAPVYPTNPAIITYDRLTYHGGLLYIWSAFCNQDEGLYLEIEVNTSGGSPTSGLLGINTVVSTTQTNANGWKRHYARGRVPASLFGGTVTSLGALLGFTTAATYLIEAPQFEIATQGSSLPSDWKQDRPTESVAIKYVGVACSGSGNTVTGFFPAGARVQSVKWRILDTITSGGGLTGFDVGTPDDLTAWTQDGPTTDITVGDETTSAAPPNHYPTATDLKVTYDGGTASGGTIKFKLEYTLGGGVSDA